MSRSVFYYTPVGLDEETLAVMKAIDRTFTIYPFFGSRQIRAYLRREEVVVGRHRVRRLMRLMGLEAVYRRPQTSQPHPEHKVYPYLLKGTMIDRPYQVWCADITYIPVRHGFLYLVAIMDCATRKVLAWRISMDGRGRCLDNIFIVPLWRSLKQEAVYLTELQGGFQTKRVIQQWISFYNTERPHSALEHQTPAEAYWADKNEKQAA